MSSFPFSAIVGQERLKLALVLAGVAPRIGGVLIAGAKGSGKSTAARALAGLLPGGRDASGERKTPFVTLPIGATEDRVVGTLDLERAIRDGAKRLEPGVLARADQGVLYVDEVNLLPDHLVDVLLDVAASGVNVVEREGVSAEHPARFVLIGTMNPEEGELRPQLLDRFGLVVDADDRWSPEERAEIVRRVMAFEADPEGLRAEFTAVEDELRDRIAKARERLAGVTMPADVARHVAERAIRENVEGIRADIVIRKSAAALAAFESRSEVTREDVDRVAELALAHRRREPPPPSKPPPSKPSPPSGNPPPEPPRSGASPPRAEAGALHIDAAGPCGATPPPPARARRGRSPGARTAVETAGSSRGPYVRARRPRERPASVALDATIRAALASGRGRGRGTTAVGILPPDLREKLRRVPLRRLYVFVLDSSRSMGAHRRMAVTKGALAGLLDESYRKRDRVALVTFGGEGAEIAVPPTRSVRVAERRARELAVGGSTPVAAGLRAARELVERERRRDPDVACSVLVVTDGRPTLGLGDLDPVAAAERELDLLARTGAELVLVDTESGWARLGYLERWAGCFGAERWTLEDLGNVSRRRRRPT